MRALNCLSDSVILWCWNQFVIKKSSIEDYLDRERRWQWPQAPWGHGATFKKSERPVETTWETRGREVCRAHSIFKTTTKCRSYGKALLKSGLIELEGKMAEQNAHKMENGKTKDKAAKGLETIWKCSFSGQRTCH